MSIIERIKFLKFFSPQFKYGVDKYDFKIKHIEHTKEDYTTYSMLKLKLDKKVHASRFLAEHIYQYSSEYALNTHRFNILHNTQPLILHVIQ